MIDVNDRNYQQETENGLVVVEFSADWCMPCRIQTPVLKELEEELDGKLKVAKMNVDTNPEVPLNYGVMSIPTLVIKKDGVLLEKFVGSRNKAFLLDKIQSYI